jgi:hypothetical protein
MSFIRNLNPFAETKTVVEYVGCAIVGGDERTKQKNISSDFRTCALQSAIKKEVQTENIVLLNKS